MSRLVDYFVVVGFDHEKERGGLSSGVILQRFPESNWSDVPFHEGIEWFCQPQGWALSTKRLEPQFYVSVLTDVDANKHYCACLCFNETVAIKPMKPADEDEESMESNRTVANITHQSVMYAPKCLVIVSRQDYIETFRNCLGIIYTVWLENLGVPLETLVGNLVGGVLVPDPGGPQVRFSIGAGDSQALQPPAAPPLPVTHTNVHMLFRLLGIHNAVTVWCAVMSEHKVLLVSLAAARLAAACRALTALMFPFRYAHVYIPLLPAGLAEVLATPTPFLIGVHASLKEEVLDLLDVIVADLDVGSVRVPAALSLPAPRALGALHAALALVLQPDLRHADRPFAPPVPTAAPPAVQDKELRAVFMRALAHLLHSYRHSLTIIRMSPAPVLTFHKAGWAGGAGAGGCPFARRLLDSMFFNGFVAERGPPWRLTDIWDDLMQILPEQLRQEALNPDLELQHIQELAQQLHLNENPNPQTFQQRILRPPEGAAGRIHQPPFPRLDPARVATTLHELDARNRQQPHKLSALRIPQPRIVPVGAPPASDQGMQVTNSARRLEVLRGCVAALWEQRWADARTSFPCALAALRAPCARAALLQELRARTPTNKLLLHHHQFDLLVRLMNCALQSSSEQDEHTVAAAMLPLATAYCRKLCTGVLQYAYMCIQEHQIWTSQQFWEAAYYQDVQNDIKALYAPSTNNHARAPSPRNDDDKMSLLMEPSALEIAAEQMRIWPTLDPEKQRELIAREESTLYSQAIHYANRMVYLLLPLEGAGRRADARNDDMDRASNSITNSVAESDSADAESGFEEAEPGEAGNNVIKMVSRFVDKVCTEGGVTAEHIRCLHQMIPGVVHMHTETLDAVARESRRLPPVQKPRIVAPLLVPGEALVTPALRAYLVNDGREASLLPAEGALFLTNYRVIFRGVPIDPFACEQTVVRSFPIMALTKEKQIRTNYLPHLEQSLQEGLQLRSATFQLIKVALDEEVSGEQAEAWRKQLARLRHPPAPLLARAAPLPPPLLKHTTLKGFAKKTLLKTARKAGLKPKPSKRQKYVLPSAEARSLTSPPLMTSLSADTLSLDEVESGGAGGVAEGGAGLAEGGAAGAGGAGRLADARTLERLRERAYAREWARAGLAAPPCRLSHCNLLYSVCRSYPAIMAVPASISDESLRRVARSYRQGRFPVLTWRHPTTGAFLARSAAPHHKGVMGMLKGSSHQTQGAAQGGHEPTSSIEQERYLATLVAMSPASRSGLDDSSLSLDSLLLCENSVPPTHTPLLSKAAGTLSLLGRNSGGKGGVSVGAGGNMTLSASGGGGGRHIGRWGSLKNQRQSSHLDLYVPRQRVSTIDIDSTYAEGAGGGGGGGGGGVGAGRRAALYVFTERGAGAGAGGAGAATLELEAGDARAIRHAFKKLLRAAAPARPPGPADPAFYRLVEESGWLALVRQLLVAAGAAADLLDLQAASVLLSLDDGWDATAQISTLAQVCLEPYYRTVEGFRVLIEKEWLALGHRFQQRLNLGPTPQQGVAPVFLLLLDAVHQVQKQFPLAFEFNDYYLRFLAFHMMSCRFRTFAFDSELARADLGFVEDKRHDRLGLDSGPEEEGFGHSLFDYIDKLHQKSPIFYNVYYAPDLDNPVLRPMSSLSCLEVWEYYVSEELSSGAPYDLEAMPAEPALRPAESQRKIVAAGYSCVWRVLPHALAALGDAARAAELARGHLPQAWRARLDLLDLPNTHTLQRAWSVSSLAARAARRAALQAHRGTTRALLRAGRASAGAAPPAPPHRWQAAPPAPPHPCDHCHHLLWPPLKGGVVCCECGALVHSGCAEALGAACRPRAAPPRPDPRPARPPRTNNEDGSALALQASQACYEQFSSNVAEDRTHEGHLYKRGALLKGWKQRWFVLDSIKHQLRYYDAMEDSHCKGFIDLAEVITVTQAPPAPGPPKKCDDRSFFDLRTSRRTYYFCACDANAAQEWIEKLQACLQ